MIQLGYPSYVTQGGDWGMFITRMMGRLYPDHVKASHTNFVLAVRMNFLWNPWRLLQIVFSGGLSAFEMAGYSRTMWYLNSGFGYFEIQSTRPQSLAYGLADSPVGLLGWLLEKLQDWTDDYPWTEDEILTWISIYWFSTAGPGASIRIYNEAANPINKAYRKDWNAWNWVPNIPLGLAYFPKDLVVPPLALGRTLGPVVHESTHKSGGHFAGWERPTELAEQLRKMFGLGGGAYGVVKGLSGYESNRKDI
jgi:pimeloyl-ACP methyl ester carboxylesterase